MSDSGRRTLTFDDRDTARIKYTGDWFVDGDQPPEANAKANWTFHWSNDLSVTFGFTFPEPAVSFTYWAFHRCCGGFYQICIDCDPVNPQWQDIDAIEAADNGTLPAVALFTQVFDTAKVRTVIVRNHADVRFGNTSQITVDRLEIVVDPNAPTSTSASSASSSSSTASGSSTSAATSGTAQKSTPTGAIAGGVAGGVVALVAAILLFLWYRRRDNNKSPSFGETRAAIIPYHTSGHPQMEAAAAAPATGVYYFNPNAQSPQYPQYTGPSSSGGSPGPVSHQATSGSPGIDANTGLYTVNGAAPHSGTASPRGPPSESTYTTSTVPTQTSGKRALVANQRPQSPPDLSIVPTMATSGGGGGAERDNASHNRTGSGGVRQEVDAGPMMVSPTGETVLPPGYHQVFGSDR